MSELDRFSRFRKAITEGRLTEVQVIAEELVKQELKRRGGAMSRCVICGKPYKPGRIWTCSEACHQKFIDQLVVVFGEFKKVVDVQTGKAYRVSTRYILEHGLKYEELPSFPEWEDE